MCRGISQLGYFYFNGRGVELDKNKAKYYFELAAMNGYVQTRYNVGCMDGQAGNYHRGMKHFILAERAGHKKSFDKVKEGFMHRIVTKDEYADTLRANQNIQDEMKSDDRDKAESLSRS